MTQEEKSLILRDICGRLLHGITIYRITDNSTHRIQYSDITENIDQFSHFLDYSGIDNIKPYLRPLSSMTDEESKEFSLLQMYFCVDGILYPISAINMVDWLNAHHFDYRGLIKKGLTIEAPENMYNF